MNSIKIIGVSGGSGSGKTVISQGLLSHFGSDHARILAQDHYYLDQSAKFDHDGGSVNFDHPQSLDFDLMAMHLKLLKSNHSIEVPQYDYATHSRKKVTTPFDPYEWVILEGTLLFSQPQIRDLLDYKFFIQTSEEVRFVRRYERDTKERGRTPEGVYLQFTRQVQPMHNQFIEPSQKYADLIVSGMKGVDRAVKKILQEISDT